MDSASQSAYEMASLGTDGIATESLDLPDNMVQLDTAEDISIADQSEALAELKESNKDNIKKALQIE